MSKQTWVNFAERSPLLIDSDNLIEVPAISDPVRDVEVVTHFVDPFDSTLTLCCIYRGRSYREPPSCSTDSGAITCPECYRRRVEQISGMILP